MRSTFLQADRSVVELAVDGYEVVDPWDSSIRISMPMDGRSPDARRIRQLHIAHRGNYDYIIEEMLRGAVYHRLSAQGGEFLVAASVEPETQGAALWRGPYHEIATYVPNSRHRDPAIALRPLMGLTFHDSPAGLRVEPHAVLNATVSVIDSSTYVRGVGAVDVRSAAEALGSVPSWAGARVAAGEVWQVRTTEDGDTAEVAYLQLATESAVVLVSPEPAALRGADPLAPALGFVRAVRQASVTAAERN